MGTMDEPARLTERPRPLWLRLLWFVVLWGLGAGALWLVSLGIRWMVLPT